MNENIEFTWKRDVNTQRFNGQMYVTLLIHSWNDALLEAIIFAVKRC